MCRCYGAHRCGCHMCHMCHRLGQNGLPDFAVARPLLLDDWFLRFLLTRRLDATCVSELRTPGRAAPHRRQVAFLANLKGWPNHGKLTFEGHFDRYLRSFFEQWNMGIKWMKYVKSQSWSWALRCYCTESSTEDPTGDRHIQDLGVSRMAKVKAVNKRSEELDRVGTVWLIAVTHHFIYIYIYL